MVKQSSKRSVKEAVELLKLIESQTSNLSEKDGDDEEVQDSVKKSLVRIPWFNKKRQIGFLNARYKNNVYFLDCDVDDIIADELISLCLATIPILLDKLSLKLNTLDK